MDPHPLMAHNTSVCLAYIQTWLGTKKNYSTHYNLEIEWMTMHSYSGYLGKEVEGENTSYSSTQRYR